MRWVMRLVTGLVVVLVLAAPLYWFFFLDSSAPQGQFTIDVAEVRR